MENIKITLETLYDILRNEKKNEDLQKLEDTFFIDVVNYLREKRTFLASKKDEDDLFASGEKDKLEYELRSIKRILKEIYEKREKKIIDITLNRSRTGSDIIDTSAMLKEEKEFYQKLLKILDTFRKGILGSLFKEELPSVLGESISLNLDKERKASTVTEDKVVASRTFTPFENASITAEKEAPGETDKAEDAPVEKKEGGKVEEKESPKEEKAVEEEKEIISKEDERNVSEKEKSSDDVTDVSKDGVSIEKENDVSDIKEEKKTEKNLEDTEKPEMTKIRFIRPMPSFVWKDMKVYGPYDEGQEVDMFSEVAELIVRKKRAEFV